MTAGRTLDKSWFSAKKGVEQISMSNHAKVGGKDKPIIIIKSTKNSQKMVFWENIAKSLLYIIFHYLPL